MRDNKSWFISGGPQRVAEAGEAELPISLGINGREARAEAGEPGTDNSCGPHEAAPPLSHKEQLASPHLLLPCPSYLCDCR